MAAEYLYRQDTIKVQNLLKGVPELHKNEGLKVQRAPISLESGLIRDTTRRTADTAPPPPTFAQIRYWRWRREQQMLIDTSRFIQPKNDVKLVTSVVLDDKGMGLPARAKTVVSTDWVTIVLLLSLVLFASVRNSYSRYLGHLFQSMVNYSTAFRMFREKNYSVLHGAFRLEAYFYVVLSVFMYQLIQFFQIEVKYHGLTLFLVTFGVVLAYFLGKKLIYQSIGFVVEATGETGEYLFNMDNYHRIAGLMLFPTVAFLAFYPFENQAIPVYFGIFSVVLFYVLLLRRGISILLKKQFSKFYLFLYLCTLEFLPLLLIYKIVVV